jgi:hypothetical protein
MRKSHRPVKAQGPPAGPQPSGQSPPTHQGARGPLWVPEGVDLKYVPEEVRQAIAEVVEPVYERFVLGVDDPLEKSLGVTVAHLLWLEVLQQFDLKRQYTQVSAVLGLPEDREGVIDQHLRIIHSKVKVGYLLARLREFRQKGHPRPPDEPSLPGPPGAGQVRAATGVSRVLTVPSRDSDEPRQGARATPPASDTASRTEGPNAERPHLVDQNEGPNAEKPHLVDQNRTPTRKKPVLLTKREVRP